MQSYASKDKPIRCSKLSWIARCSVAAMLNHIEGLDEDDAEAGGPAAQTGSAVHHAIAKFHTTEGHVTNKIAAGTTELQVVLQSGKYPLADPTECRLFLTPYMQDPRNQNAKFARCKDGRLAVELTLDVFEIPPHEIDPTGQPIYCRGTLDQIRVDEYGRKTLWDIKTGSPSGLAMIHDYAYQQAGYILGAQQLGFTDIECGGLIRVKTYRERGVLLPSPDNVFWDMPFEAKDCVTMLDEVALKIALIRRGLVNYGAGVQCTYCPHGGLSMCRIKGKEKLGI